MKIGTKSVLYGYHQFLIHPFFVAWGWTKLYGFPWDPRLWACFFLHDLGYWGKPNMDGPEGEKHVLWGAEVIHRLFDPLDGTIGVDAKRESFEWGYLSLLHSRYYAKQMNAQPSRLCFADKLAFILYPEWLALTLYWLTGEWKEYYEAHKHEVNYPPEAKVTMKLWFHQSRKYVAEWIKQFMSGDREDTWTRAKPSH